MNLGRMSWKRDGDCNRKRIPDRRRCETYFMDKKPIDWSLDELLLMAPSGGKNVEYAIGFYYENGVHTQVDPAQAVAWYEKAAKKGHRRRSCVWG